MSGDGPAPSVLPLVCPSCGNGLPASSNDVAFRCPHCGRGWEIGPQGYEERAARFVIAPTSPVLYLPYWSFPVSARATPVGERDASLLSARDLANELDRAFVAACAIDRPTYVGEWGMVYTRKRPAWEVREGPGPAAAGACLSSDDAAILARQYVLTDIDRAADLGRLDLEVEIGTPELWAIPCLDRGDTIRCPWTGSELPSRALDDIWEIRTANSEYRIANTE